MLRGVSAVLQLLSCGHFLLQEEISPATHGPLPENTHVLSGVAGRRERTPGRQVSVSRPNSVAPPHLRDVTGQPGSLATSLSLSIATAHCPRTKGVGAYTNCSLAHRDARPWPAPTCDEIPLHYYLLLLLFSLFLFVCLFFFTIFNHHYSYCYYH